MVKKDSGQALIEAAIVVPFMIFVFLCLLQIMLIAHTRVLLDYAAFNAARAGVVHNGDKGVMRNAALLSMLPAFGRVDTPQEALETWAKVKVWAEIGGLVDDGTHLAERFLNSIVPGVSFNGMIPDVSLVNVDILNPSLRDFGSDSEGHDRIDNNPTFFEIDFDLAARLDKPDEDAVRKTRLTIRLQYLYLLRVPVAKETIFYLFMLNAYLRARLKQISWINWYAIQFQNEQKIQDAIANIEFVTIDPTDWPNGPAAIIRDNLMFQGLKRLAAGPKVYIMPLHTMYSMPMESNLYRKFVE